MTQTSGVSAFVAGRIIWTFAFLGLAMLLLWPLQGYAYSWLIDAKVRGAFEAQGHTVVGFMVTIQAVLLGFALSLSRRVVPGTAKLAAWPAFFAVDGLILGHTFHIPVVFTMATWFVFRPLLDSLGIISFLGLNVLMFLMVGDEIRRDRTPPKEAGVVTDIVQDVAADAVGEVHGRSVVEAATHSTPHLTDFIS